ncbi:MAG: GNAT family N-acetyltransferase [Bacteroidia bacterium]|nr:GNAT family N-acetyltransferase [Bacteroidia bacterium]
MEIKRLEWDSDFFGYEVASCAGFSAVESDLAALQNAPFKLLYVGLNQALTQAPDNFFLADEKIVLEREIGSNRSFLMDDGMEVLHENSEQLTNLALQSGLYSRFKVDPNFKNNEFEKLYAIWIENSLKKEEHQHVFAYISEGNLEGFVSISVKSGVLNIGLIAVNEHTRGKGIGKKLIDAVCNYAQQNGFKKISVVTQAANENAMNFYHKNSFQVVSRTFIYHVWK